MEIEVGKLKSDCPVCDLQSRISNAGLSDFKLTPSEQSLRPGVYSIPEACMRIKSDINITPLIDVLLVLLVIFMVITPLTPQALMRVTCRMGSPVGSTMVSRHTGRSEPRLANG